MATSSLKNPVHTYTQEGDYVITLVVEDQGGYFGDKNMYTRMILHSQTPISQLMDYQSRRVDHTNQRVQFSAFEPRITSGQSSIFHGTGETGVLSGIGLYEVSHVGGWWARALLIPRIVCQRWVPVLKNGFS